MRAAAVHPAAAGETGRTLSPHPGFHLLVARWAAFLLLLLSAVAGTAGALPAQLPSDARWWSFDTERFRVHYHDPALEPAARRAAFHAEAAYDSLSVAFVEPPRGRIELVVADNVDSSNGLASSFPVNRIVVYVHPPVDEPSLAFFDDWLRLVVTHELTHIFHLDQAGGIWRPLRRVFGRTATLFPQYTTPGWVIEGLATFFESQLTDAGRVRGTHHDMVLRAAILEDAFFSIDRATGAPVAWPGGASRYIYGSLFVAYLAERYGIERVGALVREVGGRLIPYRLDSAARRAFGVSFSRAWEQWQDSLRVHYSQLADSLRAQGVTEPEILTPEGRYALYPRVAPADGGIAYASYTLRDEPSTRLISPDGERRVVAPRNSLDRLSWYRDGSALLTAEREYQDPFRIYSDLFRVEAGGRRLRLTDGARLLEPDVHPDGRRAVAVGHAPGTNRLVVVELHSGAVRSLVEPALETHWTSPRWSPDGARVAAARWEQGGFFDVVVLDSTGAVVRELTRDRAIDTDPSWSPDGRYVIFSSDRTGIANLYAYDLSRDTLLQVTNVLTGAFQPDVSRDGRWIAFTYYSANGYHVARIPFDPLAWRPASPVLRPPAAGPVDPPAAVAPTGGPSRRYAPVRGLFPTGWVTRLESGTRLGVGFGAMVEGRDVVERHHWSADALVYPRGGQLDARLDYRYRGWANPQLDLTAWQQWNVALEASPRLTPQGDTLRSDLFRRERQAAVLAQHQWPRWRRSFWLGGGLDVRQLDRVWDHPWFAENVALRAFPLDLGARLFGGLSTARGYGYSISPEEGVTAQLSGELRRYARPFQGEATAQGYGRLLGIAQGFQPVDLGGFARHALALRAAAGVEVGSVGPGFGTGGVSGATVPIFAGVGVTGVQRTFGIRGYPAGAQLGDRALAATVEYRFPLALVERGVRTWPLFLDRIWGDLFVDAGTAWCTRNCGERFVGSPRGPSPLTSAGAELAVSSLLGYDVRLLLRAGAAMPLRPLPAADGTPARRRPQLYLVAGRSF